MMEAVTADDKDGWIDVEKPSITSTLYIRTTNKPSERDSHSWLHNWLPSFSYFEWINTAQIASSLYRCVACCSNSSVLHWNGLEKVQGPFGCSSIIHGDPRNLFGFCLTRFDMVFLGIVFFRSINDSTIFWVNCGADCGNLCFFFSCQRESVYWKYQVRGIELDALLS